MLHRLMGLGLIAALVLVFASWAMAEKPGCTGDRHYDDASCYAGSPTTTTLPTLEPKACPDPPPCPACECVCDGASATVEVSRCPGFPDYVPCRKKKDGTLRCPRPKTPKRVLHPVS